MAKPGKSLHDIRAALVATTWLTALVWTLDAASAATRHWKPAPATNDFNTIDNWVEGIAPATLDTAIFDASTATTLQFSSAVTTVGGFTFNLSGASYVFTIDDGRTLTFDGAGIVMVAGATPASVSLNNAALGLLYFTNAASAGASTIATDGTVQFFNSSTAGSSHIVIHPVTGQSFPQVLFRDNSTAGNATIINNFVLRFFENSSAGNATITTGSAAEIIFFNTSTAANARITDTGATGVSFFDDSTAGSATIDTSSTNGVKFIGTSGAATANITNRLSLVFTENSSAENATITTVGTGPDSAGTHFALQASGGNARFIFGNNGFLNIRELTTGGTTAGSIESAAPSSFICLGGNTLTVGGNNRTTTFAGNFTSLGCGGTSTAGGLTKTGTGTLNLTGVLDYGGATTVASGALTIAATDGGEGGSGLLDGSAAFNVLGGATAILGATAIGENGNGATLSNIGAISVASDASLYLDDNTSIAATNATFAPGSTFQAFFTTNTAQHARISVSGSAALGGSFEAWLDPDSFSGTTQRSFLYNGVIAGLVTGTFGSVTIHGAPSLFRIRPLYNSFDVLIERLAFTEFADPDAPNQDAVGGALEEIFQEGTSDPDLQNLIDVIAESSSSDIADIYDAIAGSTQAETDLAAQKADDPWKQSVGQRVDAARSTGCTVSGDTWCFRRYAKGAPAPVQTDAPEDPDAFAWLDTGLRDVGATSVWGRIVGVWGETDGGVSSPASRQRTFGFIAGADHVVNSTLLVGLAGQYVRTKADFEDSLNESRVESIQAGAYFSYGGAEAYLNGNISGIATHSSTNRIFSIGAIDYNAAVRFPATSVTSSLELGQIYELDGYRLEPHVGMNYAGQFTDAYREHGAGGLGLIVDPDDLHSLRSIVGARASRVYDLADRKIVPSLRLEWRHEYLDRNNTFVAAFQGAPDATFEVSCEPSARDTAVFGTSLTAPISGRLTGYIDAEGAFSQDARSGTISLGARATW